MLSNQKTQDILKSTLAVLALCFLMGLTQRFSFFLVVVIGIYLLAKKRGIITLEKFLGLVTLALVFFYMVIPGIAAHIWHKMSSHNFDSAIHYLSNKATEDNHIFIWNATATHSCDASVMHDFLMSEVLEYHKTKNVTFVPGPQYSAKECIKAVAEFKRSQTRFYPAAFEAPRAGIRAEKIFIFSPESHVPILEDFLKGTGREYKVVHSAKAGPIWDSFYGLLLWISRFTNHAPGYLILEMR